MIVLDYIQKKFIKNPDSEKVFKNIFWLLQGRFLNYFISFLVGIYTIKRLGPDNYGLFAYCYAFTSLFITLSGFGIREIVIRELVKDQDNRHHILNSAITILFTLATVCTLVNILLVYILNHGDFQVVQINLILCIALLFVPFNIVGYLFDSILESKKVVRIANLALIVTGLLKVASVTFSQKLTYYAFATIAENVIVGLGLLYIYRRDFKGKVKLHWNKTIIVPLLKDSWPLAMSSIAIWIYMRVDQIMIKQLGSNTESGLYAAGVRLVEMLYIIPMVIQSSFLPKLVELHKKNQEAFFENLSKVFRIVAILSYSIVVVYVFSISWVIKSFLGVKYQDTILICRILIFVFPLVGFGVIRGIYLSIVNVTKIQLKITVISCILNVALNFALIPRYGAVGSVVAILITQFFSAYLSSYFFKALRPIIRLMNRGIFLLK